MDDRHWRKIPDEQDGLSLSGSDGSWMRLQSSSSHGTTGDDSFGGESVDSLDVETSAAQDVVGALPETVRQTSCGSHDTASSAQNFAEPEQTLIFLDWDDTLFPCTEIMDRWGPSLAKRCWDSPLQEDLEAKLRLWRDALHEYLCIACALSQGCTIITSSTPNWVERCVDRFAPNLRPLFASSAGGLRVVYANTKDVPGDKKPSAKDITAAKLAAMRSEATRFYSRYPQQTWKNILSLGDMKYEHDALLELASSRQSIGRERLRTKAILLPRGASLSELTLRLQFSKLMLPAYVRYPGDIDLDMRTAVDPLQEIAKALDMPELGELPFPRHAWGRTPTPADHVAAEALDEVAVLVHDLLQQERESKTQRRSSGSSGTVAKRSVAKSVVSGACEFAATSAIAYRIGILTSRGNTTLATTSFEVFCVFRTLPAAAAAAISSIGSKSTRAVPCTESTSRRTPNLIADLRLPWWRKIKLPSINRCSQALIVDVQTRWIGHLFAEVIFSGLSFSLGRKANSLTTGLIYRIVQLIAALVSQLRCVTTNVSRACIWLACIVDVAIVPQRTLFMLKQIELRQMRALRPFLLAMGFSNGLWYWHLQNLACHHATRRALRAQLYCNVGAYLSSICISRAMQIA